MRRNRALALAARDMLCAALEIEPPAPDALLGPMAAVPLPAHRDDLDRVLAARPTAFADALQDRLIGAHGVQVPVWSLPRPVADPSRPCSGGVRTRLLRVSTQLYNSADQCRHLAGALREELARERAGGGF